MDLVEHFGDCQVVPTLAEGTDHVMCECCVWRNGCSRRTPEWQPDNHIICREFQKLYPVISWNSFKENFIQFCNEWNVKLNECVSYKKQGDRDTTYYVRLCDHVNGTLYDNEGNLRYVAKGYSVPYKYTYTDFKTKKECGAFSSTWHIEVVVPCEETLRLAWMYAPQVDLPPECSWKL